MSTEQTALPIDIVAEPDAPQETATAIALRDVSTSIAAFDAVEAGLVELEKKYTNVVFDVSTSKGMKEAKEARLAIRQPRYDVQNAVEGAKKQMTRLSKAFGARGELIIGRLTPLEDPIDAQIKAEETRQAEAKAKRDREEKERKDKIEALVAEIRDCLQQCVGQDAAYISTWLEWLDSNPVTEEFFQERTAEATALHASTRTMVETMLQQAQQLEEQRREIEAEKARRAIDDSLRAIRAMPLDLIDATAADLRSKLEELDAYVFGDRVDEANAVLQAVGAELRNLLDAAEREEAKEAKEAEAAKTAQAQEAAVEQAAAPVAAPAAAPAPQVEAPSATAVVTQIAPATSRFRNNTGGASRTAATRPTDDQIIRTLSIFYRVHESKVIEWLLEVDLNAASERMAAEFAA